MKTSHAFLGLLSLGTLFLTGCAAPSSQTPTSTSIQLPQVNVSATPATFGTSVKYEVPNVRINPAIAKDFSMGDIQNLSEMEKAYGFTFTPGEKNALSQNKFVIKNILDTNIRPDPSGDNFREFIQLYKTIRGGSDPRSRGQQNAIFYSSDVFFNAYNNLYTELLKEMENTAFYPAMKALSKELFDAANQKLAAAASDAEKLKWKKVRNYFAVPYAIFFTAAQPLTAQDYGQSDPEQVMADFAAKDAKVDTAANVETFVKGLKLDSESQAAVLADIEAIYAAGNKGVPAVFSDEYQAYSQQEKIVFQVDYTQFTPRGTYTSSSLRRQYFRGMKWFIDVPFFIKSAPLTTYAFAISQLLAEHSDALKNYNKLEAAINFLVGTSDDLMPVDYLQALASAKGSSDPAASALDYLAKAHNPKIKDLGALYPTVGTEQSADVLLKTKGMRFFSGKYIMDSFWTGFLTQGDEAPRPGYTQKLPPMASSLEVMALLGSDYAASQIPKLDFYSPNNAKAIDQAMKELEDGNAKLVDKDWQQNIYTTWLWTIKSLFEWQSVNKTSLPRFMQSAAWNVKTLMTASAFWTELRHATILYAKQSFAEMGGGPGACDTRSVPPPPKAYIEPQLEAFARLSYLAKRTDQGLKDQGYQLQNLSPLESFINLMDLTQSYVKKELENTTFTESVTTDSSPDPLDPSKTCVQHIVAAGSDWETLRVTLLDDLSQSLPIPVEGPILSAKDRRAAILADVHTGGDSSYPTRILYEGTGVPYVIFAAVEDANGPRLTAGFTYSHYEFTKLYGGQRLTDEDWQKNFYIGSDPYNAYQYTKKSSWPKENAWYAPLFNLK